MGMYQYTMHLIVQHFNLRLKEFYEHENMESDTVIGSERKIVKEKDIIRWKKHTIEVK